MSKQFTYTILIHYSEIALKKNNRKFFEKIFINNIKVHTKNLSYKKIYLKAARIFISDINHNEWDHFKKILKNVMGLKNATLMIESETTIENIKSISEKLVSKVNFETYRITTKRHDKSLSFDSRDINIKIGQHIQDLTKKSVSLKFPDINIRIELLQHKSYIGFDQIKGYSGLPANCQEKALSLISSGIDSPVASFEMIKRGVSVDYIHFHSYPATSMASIENVKKLLNVLSNYQLKSNLFLVPLLEIQQSIMAQIPDKYWVIFFRRYMVKIANEVSKRSNAIALITGDSIGQVASQTLSNIRAISNISELPILRPLAGYNKEDIVNKAKAINTYDISVEPYQDCCSFFVPPHPETKARMTQVDILEKKLNLEDVYNKTLDNIEECTFNYMGN
tara:strand:+ start:1810 stop:2991 length:1182 start_codon:yes stop_codon:yes gene_type:complete